MPSIQHEPWGYSIYCPILSRTKWVDEWKRKVVKITNRMLWDERRYQQMGQITNWINKHHMQIWATQNVGSLTYLMISKQLGRNIWWNHKGNICGVLRGIKSIQLPRSWNQVTWTCNLRIQFISLSIDPLQGVHHKDVENSHRVYQNIQNSSIKLNTV
jgi:hypothetical protein